MSGPFDRAWNHYRTMQFNVHHVNASPESARLATYDGKPHVVAPVVAVQEGVLKDKYLPREEIELVAQAFSGTPLPVGHPATADGTYTSANSPDTLDAENVGRFFNVHADGPQMKGEAWVDVLKSVALATERAPRYGASLRVLSDYLSDEDRDQIADALAELPDETADIASNAEGMLEVSTAYWFLEEDESGEFDGNAYDGVQRHLLPDHLALLPHKKGECSVEDGCGAPRVNTSGQTTMTPPNSDPGPLDALSRTREWIANQFGSESNDSSDESPECTGNADDCDCGCGGDDSQPTQTNMNHEQLKEMGLSDEAIEAMSEDDINALADSLSADDDGDGTDPSQTQNQTDDGTTGDDDVDPNVQALTETVTQLAEEVSALKEQQNAAEKKEREKALEVLTDGNDLTADDFSETPTPALKKLAAQTQSPTADMAGRVPFGVPAQQQNDDGDADVEEARKIVAAMNGEDVEGEA